MCLFIHLFVGFFLVQRLAAAGVSTPHNLFFIGGLLALLAAMLAVGLPIFGGVYGSYPDIQGRMTVGVDFSGHGISFNVFDSYSKVSSIGCYFAS